MKTIDSDLKKGSRLNFLPKLTLLLFSLLFMSMPKLSFGQAPACYYLVHNSTECTATVKVTYYSDCINNTICSTSTQNVAPNGNAYFNCSPGCNPASPCNISVSLEYLGGTTFIGLVVDENTIQNSVSAANCGITVNMDWGPSTTLISVGP